jgi:site-specific recombinase XerC
LLRRQNITSLANRPIDFRAPAQLDAYRDLLVDQRGMSASTVRNHMRTVTAFLNNAVCSGIPLAKLSMPTVDRFVADSGERVSG